MVRWWGTVRGYGGPSVLMLSTCTVDAPPGPSVAAVHGPGGPSMAAALGLGGRLWGTIGSVTGVAFISMFHFLQ